MFCLTEICVYVVSIQIIWVLLPWIYKNIIVPFINTPQDLKKFGSWAVITGATDGIGKYFCHELAEKGINICLISRSTKKLQDAASEIENRFNVKTRTIQVDFTHGIEIYNTIEQRLTGLDIGILVNNVGIFTDGHFKFHELTQRDNFLWDIIACNVISVPFMTKIVIEGMLKKRCGLILNLASLAATAPFPYSLYSSSKAYVRKFSEDLALEYQGSGVEIQSINPGPVLTNMWTMDGGKLTKPTAKVYVRSVLQSIGTGIHHVIGYPPHVIMDLFIHCGVFVSPYLYWKITNTIFANSKKK